MVGRIDGRVSCEPPTSGVEDTHYFSIHLYTRNVRVLLAGFSHGSRSNVIHDVLVPGHSTSCSSIMNKSWDRAAWILVEQEESFYPVASSIFSLFHPPPMLQRTSFRLRVGILVGTVPRLRVRIPVGTVPRLQFIVSSLSASQLQKTDSLPGSISFRSEKTTERNTAATRDQH